MGACAVALWCALVLAAGARAAAYTVDCNHDYTDCDTELSKITGDDDESPSSKTAIPRVEASNAPITTTTSLPILTTQKSIETITENTTEVEVTTERHEAADLKPKPRLLNLSVDELQSFANALHNQTSENNSKKNLGDLSDVTLDDDDDEPRMPSVSHHKEIPDKFYSNLQAPFHPSMTGDKSEEMETCKENDSVYKVGERMDRGCEETCDCMPGGIFECSPRCKHPYIRRGRRLSDPLCFESPVDECCSIIACANTNGEMKPLKLEMCRYGNDTYQTGSKWNIGCEQTCVCEPNSIVTCKPRCNPLPPSDKCINVQDPKDACCEVQVCDVSQDVHEEPAENVTISTTTSSSITSTRISTSQAARGVEDYDEPALSSMRPLVLSEPIGSVKVLQNNTVQVNLMHFNNSEDPIHLLLSDDGGKSFRDVELRYSNLILNLIGGKDYILKTKETGTRFNFTITASGDSGVNEVQTEEFVNSTKVGCYHDGVLHAVGEEFHIGCSELCECTGPDTHECVALVCPSHVGLELMSKGCVRWAPSPPAQPPNCCPRSARCLSDGTCHYKGIAVPNWSEVPISLTGCEERCFCENGELDCQEVCTPLPPIPPQTLRCPPMHRPAAVNISDEDCCKEWGCVPNAGTTNGSTFPTHSMRVLGETPVNYVTPVTPFLPTTNSQVLPKPQLATDSIDIYRHLTPAMSFPKHLKPVPFTNDIPNNPAVLENHSDNMTVFTLEDIDSFQAQPPQISDEQNWEFQNQKLKGPTAMDFFQESHTSINQATHSQPEKHNNYLFSHSKMHDLIQHSKIDKQTQTDDRRPLKVPLIPMHDTVKKVPPSTIDNLSYFIPINNKKTLPDISYSKFHTETKVKIPTGPIETSLSLFQPILKNKSTDYLIPRVTANSLSHNVHRDQTIYGSRGKQVTILRNKDLPAKLTNDALWAQDSKTHVLTNSPNPYETVLLRAVPNAKNDVSSNYNKKFKTSRVAGKTYSAINLEHLLSQMDVESEVNRNLGRSADKNQQVDVAGQTPPPELPQHQPHPKPPSFLPTISPEIHFPQDDIPDYDQSIIHRPVNSLEPALQGLPPGLTVPPGYGDLNKKLTVITIQTDSPTSIKMLFGLPPVLVGLRGSVDLRYTDTADEDISHWYSQVFAPADEVLTTPRLEFRLSGLKPSTTYKIRGKLYLHNLPVEPESEVYSVRTQDIAVAPTEEKRRKIDSRLTVVDVNDTTAHMSWRHFTEEELRLIDGIQVRYRPVGTPIYIMTELLHHSRSAAELHDLRPGSRYEASLVLVPPPRASTELHDPGRVEFTTSPYIDPYNWSVIVETRAVGSEAAELTWRGVPSPAERWVRVYRAAHACGDAAGTGSSTGAGGRREHDAFRLAARDLPPAVTLTGLEPNTRCRVWLELFLTNGKVKTSNVLEINTKSLDSDNPIDNEIEASSVAGSRGAPRGDYYGALVVVGVVAALGALTSLLLLLVVVRRHRPHSVPITSVPSAPRESSLPPYDNPAYKLELQQETMDL